MRPRDPHFLERLAAAFDTIDHDAVAEELRASLEARGVTLEQARELGRDFASIFVAHLPEEALRIVGITRPFVSAIIFGIGDRAAELGGLEPIAGISPVPPRDTEIH